MTRGNRQRILIGMVVAAGVMALLVYGFTPPAVDVDLAAVQRGELVVTVDEDGQTRVRERYVIASPLEGRLQRTPLHSGDSVVAGQTIVATIEASDASLLDDRARAEAAARVQAAEAHREQATPLIERATDALEIAKAELHRAESLHGKGVITPEMYDTVRLKYRLAAHDQRVAEFNRTIAEFELAQAQAALVRFTERPAGQQSLYRHEISSPISGRVFRVFEENAAPVVAGTRLIEVGDPTDLEIEIDVLSTDAVRIRPGARVWLSHWGGDAPLEARVRVVEPSAFTKVSALGIEEQRVWIIADIVTPFEQRQSLGDNFRVEASIVTWESSDVLKAPAGALFRQGDDWAAYVVRQGRAVLQRLQVGQTNGLETEILAGLAAGEMVILHPSDRVVPAARIVGRQPAR